MLILGLDPGIERVGWGILRATKKELRALAWGRITTKKTTPFSKRLLAIAKELRVLIAQWKPECIAIEEIFFAKNLKTAIGVSHARGVLLLVSEEAHIPVVEFTPLQIKQTLTGYGRAEKHQIQVMLQTLMKIHIPRSDDDAADALAVAYTAFVTAKKS